MKNQKKADDNWRKLNQQLEEAMKRDDFKEMSRLYFEMGLQKNKEGKSSFEIQQLSQKMQLIDYKNSDVVKSVEILAAPDSCKDCKNLEGKKFTLDEALEKMPLPVKSCIHKLTKSAEAGWCRCVYLPITRTD